MKVQIVYIPNKLIYRSEDRLFRLERLVVFLCPAGKVPENGLKFGCDSIFPCQFQLFINDLIVPHLGLYAELQIASLNKH
jgi:hypothetical protein